MAGQEKEKGLVETETGECATPLETGECATPLETGGGGGGGGEEAEERTEKEGHCDTLETEGVKDGREMAESAKPSKRSLKRGKKWEERQQRLRERRREEKKRQNRRKREKGIFARRIPLSDERASNVKVALDCAFDQLMTQRELEGLAKQIKFCYASNRASAKPLQLHLCGYAGGIKECLSKSSPEHAKWDMHLHSQNLTEVFPPDQLVYLTADSSDVIREVSGEKCYVIGGLLDHNRHKRACLGRASGLGTEHGRLGLDDIVKLSSRSVLAVNHVFDIMLRYVSSGDWKEAILGGLPPRKIECVKEDQSECKDSAVNTSEPEVAADSSGESIPI